MNVLVAPLPAPENKPGGPIAIGLSALALAIIGAAVIFARFGRKNGQIVRMDLQRKAEAIRQYHDQLVGEIGFPAEDSNGKDSSQPGVSFGPESKKIMGKANDPLSTKLGKDL